MTRKKIETIITLALIPILIFIVYKNLFPAKVKNIIPSQTIQQVKDVDVSAREKELERIKGFGWARDPFVFGEARISQSGLVLNGIVWDEKSPSAIINSTVVRIGDEIEGSRVVDIQKERVVLIKDATTYELNLRRGEE